MNGRRMKRRELLNREPRMFGKVIRKESVLSVLSKSRAKGHCDDQLLRKQSETEIGQVKGVERGRGMN